MAKTPPPYLETFSRFITGTRFEQLPRAVVERARWVIADCLAVIGAGMQVPEMRALAARHLERAAPGEAWVVGSGRRAGALDAAFLNGIAGTWLELDEGNVHAAGHPGIQLVPAAIAYAQEHGASGADLLAAVVIGYEVSSRIGRAACMRPAVHTHGTYGVIGAAIAVGRLAGLDASAMAELLNVSATLGLATSYRTLSDGATVRNVYAGHSGMMGQLAVRLVASGVTGEADGVSSIYGGVLGERFDPEDAIAGLGEHWLFLDGYFKLHPTGRSVHSAIDALQAALAGVPGGRVDPAAVERIEVTAYRKTAVLSEKAIANSFGARFSVPFALATILYHGRSGLESFSEAAVANPVIRDLCSRVFISEDPSYTAAYPGRQLCDVNIILKNGSRIAGRSEMMKGEPANPHGIAELEEKYLELAAPVWGEQRARALLRQCLQLERIADFRAFAATLAL